MYNLTACIRGARITVTGISTEDEVQRRVREALDEAALPLPDSLTTLGFAQQLADTREYLAVLDGARITVTRAD